MATIDILLSTYNGEKYLTQLIDSLLGQSYKDWRLVIRDDGSSDRTLDIISGYIQCHHHRIVLMADDLGSIGPAASFGKLLTYAKAPWVMFCDQDDVWLEHKILISLTKMEQMQEQWGQLTPLLVFTDSEICTADLKPVGSLHSQMKIDIERAFLFKNLILRNVIFGHSIMINQVLVKLSVPMPNKAYMHDWWAGIIAAAYGKIAYVPEVTTLYRQHETNAYGYNRITLMDCLVNFPVRYKKYMLHQEHVYRQIQAFTERFECDGLAAEGEILPILRQIFQLAHLDKLHPWKRLMFLFNFYQDCAYKEKVLADMLFYYDFS